MKIEGTFAIFSPLTVFPGIKVPFQCKCLQFPARMLMTFRFEFLFETEKAFKYNAIL